MVGSYTWSIDSLNPCGCWLFPLLFNLQVKPQRFQVLDVDALAEDADAENWRVPTRWPQPLRGPKWFKIREVDKDIGLQNSCNWNQEDGWNITNQCQMEVFNSDDDFLMFNRYDSILRTIGSNMALHVMFFWTSRIDWLNDWLIDWLELIGFYLIYGLIDSLIPWFIDTSKRSQRADDHQLVFWNWLFEPWYVWEE